MDTIYIPPLTYAERMQVIQRDALTHLVMGCPGLTLEPMADDPTKTSLHVGEWVAANRRWEAQNR